MDMNLNIHRYWLPGSIFNTVYIEAAVHISITIPDTYNGRKVTTIGAEAFLDCRYLKQIQIPESITTIEKEAFYFCTSLSEITFPDSLISIGDDAFKSCFKLTSVDIPENVSHIGKSIFYHCSLLETVNFADSSQWQINYSGANISGVQQKSMSNVFSNPIKAAEELTKTYAGTYTKWYYEK